MTCYAPLGRLARLTLALLLVLLLAPLLAGTPAAPPAQAAPQPAVPLDSAIKAAAAANHLPVALLAPLPHLPIQATLTWSGTAGDGLWSNPANWAEGRIPGPTDQVQIPAGAGDSRIDPGFGGMIAGLRVETGYGGTLRLENSLLVAGTLHLGSGKLEQGRYALHVIDLSQPGGELVGGQAPLIVDEAARVGGLLTTPSALMSARSLEIAAGAVVRLGTDGKLNLTGEGSPLTGEGLLDVMTHRPNSVELTGKVVSDIALAGPAGQLRAAGLDQLDPTAGLEQAGAAPPPAIPWLKPPLKPMAAFAHSGSLTLATGEGNLMSAVIDPINNFAYFGMASFPGRIVKINTDPANFARVGVITLNPGEDELLSAVIDPANGFAYFGTLTSPGQVVKINITPAGFARTDAITLNPGENGLPVAVIDLDEEFAYFGTAASPAQVVKINIDPANFSRVDAITLNSGENNLRSAVIDLDEDFAYFGTNTIPGQVVKINIDPANFARTGAITLNSGEDDLRSAVIDPANSFAYFGTNTTPGRVVKVNIDPANFARTGAITLNGAEVRLFSAVIDPANKLAYFGTSGAPSRVVKVNIDPANFARVGFVNLSSGENFVRSAVIDLANNFVYFGTSASFPGRVVKLDITPANFVRVDAVTLLASEHLLQSAVIDPANKFAYFGTEADPGLVVKVNLDPANFARVGVVTLNPGEGWLRTGVIDPAKGFAYFTTYASTSQVVKVNITPAGFARVGAITLNPGEGWIYSAVIDPTNNFAYFGTYSTNPGLVIKVNTDPANFARTDAITLPAGEHNLISAVIDPASNFAYFGTYTFPGRVIKVNTDPANFTRADAITLNSGEDILHSAVIDPANNFAYFGTSTSPGRVVKINLNSASFSRVDAITLNPGENALWTAVIDPANSFAYFGMYEDPGGVVKVHIDPANFARVAAVTLNPEEEYPVAAVIDPASGFAYFGMYGGPSRVVRLDVSPTPPEMAVLGDGQAISAGDTNPSLTDLTDFGGVTLGGTITHTFTISNSGDKPLAITALDLNGAAAGDFTVSGVTTPLTVTAHTTTTFQLRFNPAVVGTRVATVTIANNDSNENPYEFAIQGEGVTPNLALAKSVFPASAAPGQTITFTLAFSNTGGGPATGVILTDTIPAGLAALSVSSSGAAITPTGAAPELAWEVQDLAPGQGGQITITTRVSPTLSSNTRFTNTAVISGAGDLAPANNTTSASVTVEVPTLAFSSGSYSVMESAGQAAISLSLSDPPFGPVTVNYATIDNTATAGSDYTATSGTATVLTGTITTIFTIPLTADTLAEANETLTLTLSSPAGASLTTPNPASLTIFDDDAAPGVSLSLAGSPLAEAAGTATVTATLSALSSLDVTANLGYSGTATHLSDYTRSGVSILIPAGSLSGTVTLTAVQDTLDEDDETVVVDITGVTNGVEDGVQQVTATITDDDASTTSIGDIIATEGEGTAVFTVSLSAASSQTISLDYSTSDNTASSGSDYTAVSGTLTLSAGQLSGFITVPILEDDFSESIESFTLSLSNPVNTVFSDDTALATLYDNDVASIRVSPQALTISEPSSTASFTITLSSQPLAAVTIQLSPSLPTQCSTPASVSLTPATWQTGVTVTVSAVDDSVTDGSQTCVIQTTATSADPTYNILSVPDVSVTVLDDDPPSSALYLPLLTRSFNGRPDLIIEQIEATSSAITVTVRNTGNGPVTDAFWVDIYFNPSQAPALNQSWDSIAPKGAAWGVTSPLAPGQRLTLTVGDRFYVANESSSRPFPAGAAVYGYVDSINHDTTHGNVPERNEQNNRFGPIPSTGGAASLPLIPQAGPPLQALPRR